MQMKLSALLKNIRDTLNAYAIESDRIIIAGGELRGLIETLDLARQAAERLEEGLPANPPARPRPAASSSATTFPRRRRARRHSPWHHVPRDWPGMHNIDNDNGNG